MADIEEKLDILIKAYMEDRQRFQSLPPTPQVSKHSNNNHLPNNGHCGLTTSSNIQTLDWQSRTAKANADALGAPATTATTSLDASTTTAGLCPTQGTKEFTKVFPLYLRRRSQKTSAPKMFPSFQSSDTCSYPLSADVRPARVYQQRSCDGFIADIESRAKKRVTLR